MVRERRASTIEFGCKERSKDQILQGNLIRCNSHLAVRGDRHISLWQKSNMQWLNSMLKIWQETTLWVNFYSKGDGNELRLAFSPLFAWEKWGYDYRVRSINQKRGRRRERCWSCKKKKKGDDLEVKAILLAWKGCLLRTQISLKRRNPRQEWARPWYFKIEGRGSWKDCGGQWWKVRNMFKVMGERKAWFRVIVKSETFKL